MKRRQQYVALFNPIADIGLIAAFLAIFGLCVTAATVVIANPNGITLGEVNTVIGCALGAAISAGMVVWFIHDLVKMGQGRA